MKFTKSGGYDNIVGRTFNPTKRTCFGPFTGGPQQPHVWWTVSETVTGSVTDRLQPGQLRVTTAAKQLANRWWQFRSCDIIYATMLCGLLWCTWRAHVILVLPEDPPSNGLQIMQWLIILVLWNVPEYKSLWKLWGHKAAVFNNMNDWIIVRLISPDKPIPMDFSRCVCVCMSTWPLLSGWGGHQISVSYIFGLLQTSFLGSFWN